MGRKVFVGNLSYSTTEDDLRQAFGQVGLITYAKVVVDRETGRSRGFGFVEFETGQQARAAMEQWNGQSLHGRQINVNEANERQGGPRAGGPAPRRVEVQVHPAHGRDGGRGGQRGRDRGRGRDAYED